MVHPTVITYKSLDGTPITETIYKTPEYEKRVYEGGDIKERIIHKKFSILDEMVKPVETRGLLEEITYNNKKEIIYKEDDEKLKIKTVYKSKEIIQELNVGLMNYAAARIPSFFTKLKYAEDEIEKRRNIIV